jgi:hypothetical protein
MRGPMIFATPVARILRAICFEASSLDKESFYVWAFPLPLFVPTDRIHFSFGDRLRYRGGDRWSINETAMISELQAVVRGKALPFLTHVGSVQGLLEFFETAPNRRNPYVMQGIAYALAFVDIERAIAALRELESLLDVQIPWQSELKERAQSFRIQLTENPSAARQQLEGWESDSIGKLKLESWTELAERDATTAAAREPKSGT